MPLYEYHCTRCDDDFEVLVRSAGDKPKCPTCAGRRVTRKLSLFGMSAGSRSDGGRPAGGSGCAGCRASSCAGCRK